MVKRDRHSPALRMLVTLMATSLRTQKKTVSNESGDKLPGGEPSKLALIDRHASDSDHYPGFGEYLDF